MQYFTLICLSLISKSFNLSFKMNESFRNRRQSTQSAVMSSSFNIPQETVPVKSVDKENAGFIVFFPRSFHEKGQKTTMIFDGFC